MSTFCRTATMDDIYHHIMTSPPPPPSSNSSLISSTLHTNKLARRQDKNDENEYEEGDVTGYAMQHPGLSVSTMSISTLVPEKRPIKKLQNANEGIPPQINPFMDNIHHHPPVNHIAGNKIGKFLYFIHFYLFDSKF